jgi:hypothetical protein
MYLSHRGQQRCFSGRQRSNDGIESLTSIVWFELNLQATSAVTKALDSVRAALSMAIGTRFFCATPMALAA